MLIMALRDSIDRIATLAPMVPGAQAPDRVLLVDGDGLAYSCAGKDTTLPAEARANLIDRVRAAARAAECGQVRILVTATGSHKGYRYAVARAKPYQAARSAGRRPRCWAPLRAALESGDLPFPTVLTAVAEADDLFGAGQAELGIENCVIYSLDKDLRQLPGWHLNWTTHAMHYHAPSAYTSVADDKVFGMRWFFMQLLHGDPTDNIPGLPFYVTDDGRQKMIGPVTANKMLCTGTAEGDLEVVLAQYARTYGVGWETQLVEQAVLLWMRRDLGSDWFDCLRDGHPLSCLQRAAFPIMERVEQARAACSVSSTA